MAIQVTPLHPTFGAEVRGVDLTCTVTADVFAEIEVSEAPFEMLESADFLENPIAQVYAAGCALRRKLADPDCAEDFPVLAELRAEGITDYLASPLIFTDGAIHALTCTTRQPGGFTDAQIAGIEAIITPLARVAEIRALRRAGRHADGTLGS